MGVSKENKYRQTKKGISELEHPDVDDELDKHEKLQNWEELKQKLLIPKKETSMLESFNESKQPGQSYKGHRRA